MAEYGCATGVTSIAFLTLIIKAVRQENEEMQILIYLNDIVENHHAIAIKTVRNGLFDDASTLSPSEKKDVFIYVAGADFTKPVFPRAYVDFAFSSMAMCSLPWSPSPLTNAGFFGSKEVLATEDGQIWMKALSESYVNFLKARETELK